MSVSFNFVCFVYRGKLRLNQSRKYQHFEIIFIRRNIIPIEKIVTLPTARSMQHEKLPVS